MDPGAPVHIHLAGVPRLVRGGTPLRTGTRKALLLAALLRLEGELRRERLAALLWPLADAGAARRNLRRDVFRLRSLGLDLAETAGDGLTLRGVEIAWPLPDGNLPLWLDGLAEGAGAEVDEWVLMQRERLHRLWVDALCEQAASLERQGHEARALQLWRALLGEDAAGPGHVLARQSALRLHQALGEHQAALALSQQGSAPASSPAAPMLSSPTPSPTSSPTSSPDRPGAARRSGLLPAQAPFVGRSAQLAAISQALQAQRLVFIDGAPGCGKTRLALQAAAPLGGVAWVRCRIEDEAAPFASALRLLALLREAGQDDAVPDWARRELSPLVPEWCAAPAAEPGADGTALQRMRRAFATAWRALARDNFAALVVDDWQWADASSLALWDVDAPATGDWPVARLVVHRSGELPALALQRRRALLDAGQAVAVRLGELDAAEVLALVRVLSRSEGGERFAARLHGATAGNPLFVLETLRHLAEGGLLDGDAQGRWRTPYDAVTTDYAELRVPATVRDTVLARVRALGPVVRRVLEAASLAGDALTPALLAAATGLDTLAAAQALEHAAAADLLVLDRDGSYRAAHDLVTQSLAESLSPARRMALHGLLADHLAGPGREPGRVAQHLQLAGRAAEAAVWHLRAGRQAQRLRARDEALRHFDLALASGLDPVHAAQAQLERACVLRVQGDPAATHQALDAALAAAQHAGREHTIDVLLERSEFRAEQNRADEALAELDALQGDPALSELQRLRLQEERAAALSHLGRHGAALQALREALAALPASALVERSRLLATLSRTSYWAGERAAAQQLAEQNLALCRSLGDEFRAAGVLGHLGLMAREAGQSERALALLLESCELARRTGNVHIQRSSLYNRIVVHTDAGRADLALPLIDEAEALSPLWENPNFRHAFTEARYYLHYLRGDAEAARQAADGVLESARTLKNVHPRVGAICLVFDLLLQCGERDLAATLLAEADGLLSQAGGSAQRRLELIARSVQLARAQGQPAQALALAQQGMAQLEQLREDDKARLLACGAEAALDLGDAALAGRWLQQAAALGDITAEIGARVQAARLRWARMAGGPDLEAEQQSARNLLADPHLPRFEAQALEAALAQPG